MRVAVVGAGGMGQLFGARIGAAGHHVVFIDDDQATLDALNTAGITIRCDGTVEQVTAQASRAESLTGEFDLMLFFTKSHQTEAAVRSVRHLVGAQTRALTLQNGLGNAEVLSAAFDPENVAVGVTTAPVDRTALTVLVTTNHATTSIGPYAAASPPREVHDVLRDAGFDVVMSDDVRPEIWEKLAFNCAINLVSAVTGQTVGQVGEHQQSRFLAGSIVDEVVAVARAQHIHISSQKVRRALADAYKAHAQHKTSMLQDIEQGRGTEIDSIGGSVVRLGQDSETDVPVLQVMCQLVGIRGSS